MNYERIYNQLIDRARSRDITGYSELHHIVPKCLGGNNTPQNLVKLTAEEHFLAHQLLMKMYPSVKGLTYACIVMCNKARGRKNNKAYAWIRTRVAESRKNTQVTELTRKKLSDAHLGIKKTAEHATAIASARIGLGFSAEHRKAISTSLKGRKQSPESIAKRVATTKLRRLEILQ